MKNYVFILLLALLANPVFAQQVQIVTVHSEKMDKDILNAVVLPDNYDKSKSYPVIYLLHGYGGKHDTFHTQTKKSLLSDATTLQVIFVSPDGQNSWYWDSPVDPKMQYETYVSKELVTYIDQNFSTIKTPKGRAVTGFSMGGHGGLWIGINHPDIFGACGSMSGGVDIRPFPDNWDMNKRLGKYKDKPELWTDNTILTQLHKIEPNKLSIIIDCGVDDFFYRVNERLHNEMVYLNIKHDFISRPGGHTHEYWNNALDYQFLFFRKFFGK